MSDAVNEAASSDKLDLSHYVEDAGAGLGRIELVIDGIRSAAAIGPIEAAVKALTGIRDARLNLTDRRLTAVWDKAELAPAAIVQAVDRLGFSAHPFRRDTREAEVDAHASWLLRCLAVAGFAAMNIMLLSVSVWSGNVSDITQETRDLFHWLSALIALPAAAYAGQPFFRSAIAALKARTTNMDVPISLGVLLALAMSVVETAGHAEHVYFDSAVMLLFFLLAGRVLDHAMRRKTRAHAGNLAALKAEIAHRLDEAGAVTPTPVAGLARGDRVLVRPGDRVPADGMVEDGTSEIDEGLVTGETMARAVGRGDMVHAGSLNQGGALTLRVRAAGSDTLICEVERLLEAASQARSRFTDLSDQVARLYAPVIHATAALTVIGWLLAGASVHDALIIAIAVLIITCPCALALAVPAVQVVASGALFRRGILLNGASAIERLAAADIVIFDKTGTLTRPMPAIANAADIDPALLAVARRLALSSRHPLARAIADPELIPVPDAQEIAGEGVAATIDGREARLGSAAFCNLPADLLRVSGRIPDATLMAVRHGEATASIMLRQVLRHDAAEVANRFRSMGFTLIVMSGDRRDAVAPVAAALGIETWYGGLKPADKIAGIEALQANGHRVLMVGDGLNDAPALAAAHASLSPISASDLTQAKADGVFLGERLMPVVEAVTIARRARRLMRQNLGLALIYNLLALPLAIAGHVTPLIAAIAMSGSSIIVTLNALRAGRQGGGSWM